jgi:Uma2 family endonuclease
MSTATRTDLTPETRLHFPGVPYHVYETLVDSLSDSSRYRLAYDGKDLEIMTKGDDHEKFRRLIDRILVNVAGMAGFRISGLGEVTWKRPDLERGIEADQCYFLTDAKIDQAAAALRSRSHDMADYPVPDLVVEIDISRPQVDRPGIYAAMGVPELWVFDGETLVIHQLRPDGQYVDTGRSRSLPISPEEVAHWLVEEDATDEYQWEERLRAWIKGRTP